MQRNLLAVVLIQLAVLTSVASASTQSPFTLRYSLFDPSTNVAGEALHGFSVALDESTAVVGAPGHEYSFIFGAANIYDSATGRLLYTLFDPFKNWNARFGQTVAVSGRRVVVSAPFDQGLYLGAVFVYDLTSATPTVPVLELSNPVPPPHGGDRFGTSLAISGNRLAIGMPWEWGQGDAAAAVFVYDLASATPTVPAITLTNAIPSYGSFGYSVAMSGSHLAISVGGGTLIYDLASATPTELKATLKAGSVAMSGSRLAISATDETDIYDLASATPSQPVVVLSINPSRVALSDGRLATAASGSVCIFGIDGANAPYTIATVVNPNANSFGSSIAICGTRVIAGAPEDGSAATRAGSAYLYDLNSGGSAAPTATLRNGRPGGDSFRASVAPDGRFLVAGAASDGGGPTPPGLAYVYDLFSTTPTRPIATLTNPAPGQGFGSGVAVSGTLAVIGGASTYVYDLSRLTAPAPIATFSNSYPWSVAISGTRVVVGEPQEDSGASSSGRAYVYDVSSPSPSTPVAILNNPGPEIGDWFGESVAISGTRVVIGAPYDNTVSYPGGSVYVYDLASPSPTVPIMNLYNPAPRQVGQFGSPLAISGSRLVISAYPGTGSNWFGAVYVYDLDSATPTKPLVKLENPTPAAYDRFGWYVAISGTLVAVGKFGEPIYLYDISRPTPGAAVATIPNWAWSIGVSGKSVFVGTDDGSGFARGGVYVFGPKGPPLAIARASSDSATISWTPVSWPDFVLQYNDTLAPDSWVNAPSGASNPVTVSSTNAARFYRLFSP